MKKTYLVLIFSLIFSHLIYSKSYYSLQGGAGFSFSYGSMPKYSGFEDPQTGAGTIFEGGISYSYFISESIALQFMGLYSNKTLKVNYQSDSSETEASQEYNIQNIKTSLGLQKYLNQKWFIAGGLNLQFPIGNWEYTGDNGLNSGVVDEDYQKNSLHTHFQLGYTISLNTKSQGIKLRSIDIIPQIEVNLSPFLERDDYKLSSLTMILLLRLNFGRQ